MNSTTQTRRYAYLVNPGLLNALVLMKKVRGMLGRSGTSSLFPLEENFQERKLQHLLK